MVLLEYAYSNDKETLENFENVRDKLRENYGVEDEECNEELRNMMKEAHRRHRHARKVLILSIIISLLVLVLAAWCLFQIYETHRFPEWTIMVILVLFFIPYFSMPIQLSVIIYYFLTRPRSPMQRFSPPPISLRRSPIVA